MVRQPWSAPTAEFATHGSAPVAARDLPQREPDTQPAPTHGEFQPLVEEKPEINTVERNNALPRPELFVKTTPTDDGYLLSFSTNHFIVWVDGYLVLMQDDKQVGKVFASPYFVVDVTNLEVVLVNQVWAHISINWKSITEKVTAE